MKYYLAYGSNLNVEQMMMRCPGAKRVGTATLKGWELSFKGSKTGSYLTIDKHKDGEVPVGVWAITDADEVALDMYEGFPRFYYKKHFVLTFDSGERHRCFAYIMRNDARYGIPTRFYFMTCLMGYRNFDFDKRYLDDALFLSEGRANDRIKNA